eukprot:gene4772-21079_t
MDLNRRESVKSAMLKSFFTNSPAATSVTKTASCQRTYKSTKKVVTSSGSKVAVYESEAQGSVTSETVGTETTTESDYSEAERYCELENEEGRDVNEDIVQLMNKEMEALMNAPMGQLKGADEDYDECDESEPKEGQTLAVGSKDVCLFGICPEGTPCQCMNDCEVDLEDGSSEMSQVSTQLERTTINN